MLYLYIFVGAVLFVSLCKSREKTLKALKLALKKFLRLVPPFLLLTIFVAVLLFLIPQTTLLKVLGADDMVFGVVMSSLLGSIAFIPGFIVFPLSGMLREQGVSFTVISAFTTTLMMVGILTLPMEIEYTGAKLAIARNISGLLIAAVTALITGIVFGELFV